MRQLRTRVRIVSVHHRAGQKEVPRMRQAKTSPPVRHRRRGGLQRLRLLSNRLPQRLLQEGGGERYARQRNEVRRQIGEEVGRQVRFQGSDCQELPFRESEEQEEAKKSGIAQPKRMRRISDLLRGFSDYKASAWALVAANVFPLLGVL